MDLVLLIARLVLAGVFVASAVAKLADRTGSRQAVSNFGVPERFAGPIAALLPAVELLIAVLLIPRATAWWGALAGLLLLLAFSAGIAYNLARGRTPECHCFGNLSSDPIGPRHLVRNGVLEVLAVMVVLAGSDDPGLSAVAWIGDLSGGELTLLVIGLIALSAIALEGWLLTHLLSQNGRLLVRIDAIERALEEDGVVLDGTMEEEEPAGLRIGEPAPAFALSGIHGETMTLDALRAAGKPSLLIFTDPKCGPCNSLLPEIGRWQREHAHRMTIALLSRGGAEANRAKVVEHGLSHVLLQKNREVAEAYKSGGTPSAVLVGTDGTISTDMALGVDAIRALVGRLTGSAAPQPAPVPTNGSPAQPGIASIGQPAPAVELPDLTGKPVRLVDFRGHPTLVLFWNPGCGFCARMLDDLKAWEQGDGAQPGAPKLLVVSTGEVAANTAQGLQSTIVLDQGFATGRAFGAGGTPSAVLVDTDGNIASAVAVGAPAVLALVRGQEPPAANGAPSAPAAKIGDEAPALSVPDLSGRTVELRSLLRGTRTMVLFWDPGCGFCSRMLDDLKAWEAKPPKGAPKLLVVSTGDAAVNRDQGLRSPILLDQGFSVGRAFGATGTPSAVLVDAGGRIASEIAIGAPAVFDLASGDRIKVKPATG